MALAFAVGRRRHGGILGLVQHRYHRELLGKRALQRTEQLGHRMYSCATSGAYSCERVLAGNDVVAEARPAMNVDVEWGTCGRGEKCIAL